MREDLNLMEKLDSLLISHAKNVEFIPICSLISVVEFSLMINWLLLRLQGSNCLLNKTTKTR